MSNIIMEALRELKNIDENVIPTENTKDGIEIKKFTIDEYIELIGAEPGDFDWDDGRKAKFIYTDADELSAQVGIELEDGKFAVVGLNNDHICADYDDMVKCIKSYM